MLWRARLWLFGPALAWMATAGVALALTATDEGAWGRVDRARASVAGSADCRRCHPAQYDTWHRSYHRTMTQDATAEGGEAVLAPFAGEQLRYRGFLATMTGGEAGRPHVRIESEADGGVLIDEDVELTIGSHRYQQYVARMDRGGGPKERWRLPVAWHRAEQRWIHLNGAFVEPEAEVGDADGYQRHLSRWNDNCIFCHNTEPVPGRDAHGRFDSEVGELGIACEACHGPASAHVARHQNPLRRMLGRGHDTSVAQPGELGVREESGVCGRCHGQRIGKDVGQILAHGDGFLPGEDLAGVSRPIFRDSTLAGTEGTPFLPRFWPDGTPRLSAYEYQGLLLSPCYDPSSANGLGCNHCHDMHGDEPAGQLRPERAGEGACADCHASSRLSGAAGEGGHGGHGARAPEVDCLDCHMPRISYGLLEGMISHRISNPDPGAWVGRSDQPDACTQCHVDRSRAWAASAMGDLGLSGSAPAPAAPEGSAASRVVLDLHGGDPIQRNLAAHALARPRATGEVAQRMAWLVAALDDEYPSVRWFAWRGLRTLAEERGDADTLTLVAGFDYLAPVEERAPIVGQLRARLGPGALEHDPALLERLEENRQDKAIWIGE